MSLAVLTPSAQSIATLVDCLKNDQVVGVPTETVYGLAGNAFSPAAVARIFETKGRPTFDPLIVHVSPQFGTLEDLHAAGIIDAARLDARATAAIVILQKIFWPGPLTLILPKGPRIADLVTGGLDSVGVRMPAHPDLQNLLAALDFPLAAPSANRFGRISPTQATHVAEELGERIPYILDGGAASIGVESTVLDCSAGLPFKILRPGGIAREAIAAALGSAAIAASHEASQKSPGHLLSHYAPKKPLILLPARFSELSVAAGETIRSFIESLRSQGEVLGFLTFQSPPAQLRADFTSPHVFRQLTHSSAQARALPATDLSHSAQSLFAVLRELDDSAATVLIAESLKQADGLAPAIQDRLQRASSQRLAETK